VLNKVKLLALVGVGLTLLRFAVPDVAIPEGIDVAIVSVILFAAAYFKKETYKSVKSLTLK
jgi:uncharacterized MnhB-related membrane protein